MSNKMLTLVNRLAYTFQLSLEVLVEYGLDFGEDSFSGIKIKLFIFLKESKYLYFPKCQMPRVLC